MLYMLRTTHQKMAQRITSEFGFIGLYLNNIAVWVDNPRNVETGYPDSQDIKINDHHNIDLNRDRIITILNLARTSYLSNPSRKNEDAIFNYCNALHFLCDSPIPSLEQFSKYDQKNLDEKFDSVDIKNEWKNILKKDLNEIEIKEVINNFLEDMPISSFDINEVTNVMKKTYQTGLLLATYAFPGKYFS